MIWVVVSALIVSLAINFCLSVLVFKVSSSTTDALDRSHERTTEYTGQLLDRLMARDFMEYRAATDTYVRESPPIEEPEELVSTMGPDRGGFGSRLGLLAYAGDVDEIRPEEEMP